MSISPPTDILLDRPKRQLTICFQNEVFVLSCEYLRVHSPSAEVQGHGPGQDVLQVEKQHVNIDAIEPIGNYAVKLVFDDGHDTGLYSWDTLYSLGVNYEHNWGKYLNRLSKAGYKRS